MKSRGFTIVELLIVIVVIAILAAISIVAYNGIQQRARDSQRVQDVETIAKALELYYIDEGRFPASSGSTTVNGSWSTSNDASWNNLRSALVPKYLSDLPEDPVNSTVGFTSGTSYSYSYYGNSSNYCGSAVGQMYILVYRTETNSAANQPQKLIGDCTTTPQLGPYNNYAIIIGW